MKAIILVLTRQLPAKWIFVVLGCLLSSSVAQALPGQLDTLFNTGSGPNGIVYGASEQPDGKVLIVGSFTTVNGTSRSRIARLNSDGSIDTSFVPPSSNSITYCVLRQNDGKILVGGSSIGSGSIYRYGVARLNTDGSLDTTFDAVSNVSSTVYSIEMQPDGKLLVGGSFTNGIVRLNANGSLDSTFVPGSGASGTVRAIKSLPSGKIIIGGSFSSINGVSRSNLARLNTDGSVDLTFGADGSGPGSTVYSIQLQQDGRILLGGTFSSVNGVSRSYLARIEADGAIDPFFSPSVNSSVYALLLMADGRMIVGGDFTMINDLPVVRIAVLHADGRPDATFNTPSGASSTVRAVSQLASGNVLFGGSFTTVSGSTMNYVARLFGPTAATIPAVGVVSPRFGGAGESIRLFGSNFSNITSIEFATGKQATFTVVSNTEATVTIPQGATAGTLTLRSAYGDSVSTVTFYPTPGVPGTFDPTFNPGTGASSTVNGVALDSQGRVLLAGDFSSINGLSRNEIARLNQDGSVDLTFNPPTGSSSLECVLPLSDGKLLVGGWMIGSRKGIARLNADGSLDSTFDATAVADSYVYAIALQADGKILIGGAFARKLSRLNSDGSADLSFDVGSGASSDVKAILVLPDGKILVGGSFSTFNGLSANYLTRLTSAGAIDTSFQTGGTGVSGTVYSLSLQADGRIIAGGSFSSVNGKSSFKYLARFEESGLLDQTYAPLVASTVYSTDVLPDGRVAIGGSFTAIDGMARNYVALIHADGEIDAGFKTANGAAGTVYSVRAGSLGKLFIGGSFSTIYGQLPARIARLEGDGGKNRPAVAGITPESASVGETITISGSNLSSISSVEFSGGLSATFWQQSEVSATARVPSGVMTGPITVRNSYGEGTSIASFKVLPAPRPTISAIPTGTVSQGEAIVVIGQNFYDVTSVKIGVLEAAFTVSSATSMMVTVPANAVSAKVKVSGPGGSTESNSGLSVKKAAPIITSAQSASGTVGEPFNFVVKASNTPTAYSATPLPSGLQFDTVTGVLSGIPTLAGATNCSVSAINDGGAVQGTLAIVIAPPPAPVLTAISPNPVVEGGKILVSGDHLIQTTQVTVGGIAANFDILSDNRIAIIMPAGVTSGIVQVTTLQGTVNSTASATRWDFIPGSQTVTGFGEGSNNQTTPPAGLNDVIGVAAGQYHSLALSANGSISAWGRNWSGQSTIPADIAPSVAISAGAHHSLALESDGQVATWGRDDEGQCSGAKGLSKVVAVAAGSYHSLALLSDGTVKAWGANWSGQTSVPTPLGGVVAIAAGGDFSAALKSDGSVVVWGDGSSGQTEIPSSATDIVAIAAGQSHIVALKSDGTILAWGADWSGQCSPPTGLTGVVQIAAGSQHGVALLANGSVVAWGGNWSGQATPTPGITDASAVAAGGDHCLVLHSLVPTPRISSSAQATGKPGQPFSHTVNALNGAAIFSAEALPSNLSIAQSSGVISGTPSVGSDSIVAVTARNSYGVSRRTLRIFIGPYVVAWGSSVPGGIPNGLTDVVQLAAGQNHCLALLAGGTVVAWGSNSYGQSTVPVGLNQVVAIAAGATFSLALKADGTVHAWGSDPVYSYQPFPEPLASNVVGIDAKGTSAVALLGNGKAQLIVGSYSSGQYGSDFLAASVASGSPYYYSPQAFLAINRAGFVVDSYGSSTSQTSGFVRIAQCGSSSTSYYYSPFDALPGWGIQRDGKLYEFSSSQYSSARMQILRTETFNAAEVSAGSSFALVLNKDATVTAVSPSANSRYYFPPSYYPPSSTVSLPTALVQVGAIAAAENYAIAVKEPALRPRFTTLPTVEGRAGQTFYCQVKLTGLVQKYEASNLPTGLSIDPVTGIISGIPQNIGITNCLVLARYPGGFVSSVINFKFTQGAQPVDLNLTGTFVSEDIPTGSEIGTISGTDPDNGDSLSFSLVAGTGGTDNSSFKFVGNNLQTNKVLDYESKPQMSIRLQVTDSGGNQFARVFLINVINVPTDDDDHDGLSEAEEILLGTNPLLRDSDIDGASDGLEVASSTDPLSASSKPGTYVAAWGRNDYGQCNVPVDLGPVIAVAAGEYHTLALKADGTVVAWGQNSSGQCDVPIGLSQVVAIAAGYGHSIALKSDGSLVAWGSSSDGLNSVPAGLSGVVQIAAGDYLNVALKADGHVVAWGTTSYSVNIAPITAQNSIFISAGAYHALALDGGGKVVGWGQDSNAQVTGPSGRDDIVSIACGQSISLGLTLGGRVLAWGSTSYDATVVPSTLGEVASIATGDYFALAVETDGDLVAWGQNSDGQTNIPSGLGPVIMADGGYGHTVALISDTPPPCILNSTINGVVGLPVKQDLAFVGSADSFTASFLPPGISFNLETATFYGTPSQSGTFNARISAKSGNSVSTGIIRFAFSMPRQFTEWREAHFSGAMANPVFSDPLSDPDSDLIPNLVEYALHLDPLLHDAATSSATVYAESGKTHLALTFERMKSAVDVRVVVEVSMDLVHWHSGYPNTVTISTINNGDSELITVRDSVSIEGSPKRFIRLRVESIDSN